MKVDEIIFATATKEISSKVSPSFHCLLSLPDSLSQNTQRNKETCLPVSRHALSFVILVVSFDSSREWDGSTEPGSSGSCRFMCSLHPFQPCWQCCLFHLQSCYPFTSHSSNISTRCSYSAENQLVGCKPEQLKGLPRLVGITVSQQHTSVKSLSLPGASVNLVHVLSVTLHAHAVQKRVCTDLLLFAVLWDQKSSYLHLFPFCIAILCSAIVSYYLI